MSGSFRRNSDPQRSAPLGAHARSGSGDSVGVSGVQPLSGHMHARAPDPGPPEGASPATASGITQKRARGDIVAFLVKLGVAVVAAWVLFGVVFGVAPMQGEAMYPRIRDGDLMVYYRLDRDFVQGDVVTFTRDGTRYTARIVAEGGDIVDIDEDGELIVNGAIQSEEIFYPTEAVEGGTEYPCTVPDGSVFVLVDFRTNGEDSRNYGPVSESELDGKVISIWRRRGI